MATAFDFGIFLLPPVSRGAHLDGPKLHAQRLVELWKVADGKDVTLAEVFRLLDVPAVEGAIWRAIAQADDVGDARHWYFPDIEKLLPGLRELAWQAMLAGTLVTEAVKGVSGKRRRTVLPAELARLTPDWESSRLTADGRDDFIDVRVGRVPTAPVKKAWRERPSNKDVAAAMEAIVRGLAPGARLSNGDALKMIRQRLGPSVTREQVRAELKKHPDICLERGRRHLPA